MEYGPDDSSGTDDDLPPPYHNRGMRGGGRIGGNGRDIVSAGPYSRPQPLIDMETQIHQLEQDAYCSVLRAFKAQSDAISWEKESLITELRKELTVSDKEHRELLNRVNNDDIIRRIREWRESTGGLQTNLVNNNQRSHDPLPSPTTSSRKRQKTSQSIPSASVPAPPPAHSQPLTAPMQPPSSAVKKATPLGIKGKKTKPGQKIPGAPAVKPMPSSASSSGRGPVMNRNSSGGIPPETIQLDPLIGRKVMTRWPDDNSFYKAVITDYDPQKGRYALVYDMNTPSETWEWVDFTEGALPPLPLSLQAKLIPATWSPSTCTFTCPSFLSLERPPAPRPLGRQRLRTLAPGPSPASGPPGPSVLPRSRWELSVVVAAAMALRALEFIWILRPWRPAFHPVHCADQDGLQEVAA